MKEQVIRMTKSVLLSAGFIVALYHECLHLPIICPPADSLQQCALFNRSKQGIANAYGFSGWKEFHDKLGAYGLYDMLDNKREALTDYQIDAIVTACGCPNQFNKFLTKAQVAEVLNIKLSKLNNPFDSTSKILHTVIYEKRKEGYFTNISLISPAEVTCFNATLNYYHVSRR